MLSNHNPIITAFLHRTKEPFTTNTEKKDLKRKLEEEEVVVVETHSVEEVEIHLVEVDSLEDSVVEEWVVDSKLVILMICLGE